MKIKNRVALIIMDGYGLGESYSGNAISLGKTPVLDSLFSTKPNTKLSASGLDVGLPDGQMGNSEVGHTNIGAGRVVYQSNPLITKSISDGSFFSNRAYLTAMEAAKLSGKALHILGLLSDGGVHSLLDQIFAIVEMAKKLDLPKVYIHGFLDGRDVSPTSGADFVSKLSEKCAELGVGKIATLQGRFWGMDRDKRWDRLQRGYDAMVRGIGNVGSASPADSVRESYAAGVTDEFFEPTVFDKDGTIKKGDSVIFMNFRPDRAREITWALTGSLPAGNEVDTVDLDLNYVCTTQYDPALSLPIAFPPQDIDDTLGEYISNCGIKQFRVAETEKYAHVTFFFNGGVEKQYNGEDRILVPSPRDFPTYDLIPVMSADEVCSELLASMENKEYGFFVCNFANCDMVGHTGILPAAVTAVEKVDECIGKIVASAEKNNIVLLITSDHGNAEKMTNADGSKNTAHTTNPVPLIVVGKDVSLKADGRLADVAPTILALMGLEKPQNMTGNSLI